MRGDLVVDLFSHEKVSVVAEIGINHGGSLDQAYALVDSAVAAGAQYVKFQLHNLVDEMSSEAKFISPGNDDRSIYDVIKMESKLTSNDLRKLKEYTEERGALFICTPFSRSALFELLDIGIKVLKIGSGEISNIPFLELVSHAALPTIFSTGMHGFGDIETAAKVLGRRDPNLAMLHCTNLYPSSSYPLRINGISQLIDFFPKVTIGYSDHSGDLFAPYLAIGRGAKIIEVHYTDDYDRWGPDVKASLDQRKFSELKHFAEVADFHLPGDVEPLAEEAVTADFALCSVVALVDLTAGDLLTSDNCFPMRPGTGEIRGKDYAQILGKLVAGPVKAMTQIKWQDIED